MVQRKEWGEIIKYRGKRPSTNYNYQKRRMKKSERMANYYLKMLATKAVNLIVDAVHLHVAKHSSCCARKGALFDLGSYWQEVFLPR